MAGGILSRMLGGGGGMLSGSTATQPERRSILDRLGFDVNAPESQVPLAFLSNVISTPETSTFAGVPEAIQRGQQIQRQRTELSQIVQQKQKQADQDEALKQMLASDPMATQFYNAGRVDDAVKLYERNKGLSLSGSADASFGQQPVFMTDENGNQKIGQMSSGGGVLVDGKNLSGLPKGWKVIARPDNLRTLDTGGGINTFDPTPGRPSR